MSRRAEIVSAFALLTRLPVGRLARPNDDAGPSRSVWAYPLVGIAVGAIGGIVYWVVSTIGAPPVVAGVFALAAMVLATGAMHEDGAADTADGLGGGADRARKLEIMRDSRIGTYGVIALILMFALRIGVIGALAAPWLVFAALTASATLSRAAMATLMYLMPPARADGLSAHVGRADGAATAEAIAIAALTAFLFLPPGTALMAMLAASIGTALIGWLARSQLGGQTGDILGAAGIAAECAGLMAVAASLV